MRAQNVHYFRLALWLWLSADMACVLALLCPKDLCQCKNVSDSSVERVRVRCGGGEQRLASLKEINFEEDATNIVSMDLSKNAIGRIEHGELRNYTELRRLELSSNLLREINPGTFGDALPNLERLKLSNNSLRHIYPGSFDAMPNLKHLDISNNPLICDCDLIWLLAWANAHLVKLQPLPKCEAPVDFKGIYLKKLKVGVDLHCESPLQPLLELIPRENQVVFEGDELVLKCRAPRVAIGVPRESEDLSTHAHVFWGWSEKVRRPNSTEDIVFSDPTKLFSDVHLETKHITDSGILNSILRIESVSRHHAGMWDCTLSSQQANLSKAIVVVVISKSTQYCEATAVRTNKGSYYWPRTVRGETVQQKCAEEMDSQVLVTYQCSANGSWQQLNADGCPFVSETTRILEQFAKMNLTLTKANALEIARRLQNFTHTQLQQGKLNDPMDLEFVARTLLKYLDYVSPQSELAQLLLDIVSQLLLLPQQMFQQAQRQHETGLKMLHAVEVASAHLQTLPLTQSHEAPTTPFGTPRNLFIDYFNIRPDAFAGISCVWLSSRDETVAVAASSPLTPERRSFECSTANDTFPIFERYIEAAVQVPVQLLFGATQQTIRLMVAVYRNGHLLSPLRSNGSVEAVPADDLLLTSAVVGVKIVEGPAAATEPPAVATTDLSDKILVILRVRPYHSAESAPVPVWWDAEAKEWNAHVCQPQYPHRNLLMFTCSRLGYYGVLQRRQYLNDFTREDAGALFHFAPVAIYVGCAVLFVCAWLNIVTFVAFGRAIRINRQQRHSFVNTWLAVSSLAFVFAVGIYQTEYHDVCQAFGILLHYFSLCVLLWLCVSLSNLYKRLSKTHRASGGAESELPKEARLKKPILGIYLVGWGIGLLICGISSAVNISEYAAYHFCFLHNAPALNAILVPALILLLFLGILLLCIYYHLNRKAVNVLQSHQFSDNTQATEHIDLDWLDSTQSTARRVQQKPHQLEQYRSLTLSNPLSSIVDDFERSNMAHLRAHFVFLLLFVVAWLSAAMFVMQSAGTAASAHSSHMYSVLFAISSTLLGLFLLLFYTLSRNDTRLAWGQSFCCANASYQPSCQSDAAYDMRSPAANVATAYKSAAGAAYDPNNSGSRSNSQCSKHRASSVRSMKSNSHKNERAAQSMDCPLLGAAAGATPIIINNQQQQHHSNGLNTSTLAHEIPSAELFYNPNQINVARKFFKKQKRLAKRNNFELQRQMDRFDFPDNISDVSSLAGSAGAHIYSRRHNAMTLLRGGSKVNNTNINYRPHADIYGGAKAQSGAAYGEQLPHAGSNMRLAAQLNNCNNVGGGGVGCGGGGFIALDLVANIYTNIPETRAPQHEVIKMKPVGSSRVCKPLQVVDTLSEHEDEHSSHEDNAPPLYANTAATATAICSPQQHRKPGLCASTPLRALDAQVDVSATQSLLLEHDAVQAMNSLGLPEPPDIEKCVADGTDDDDSVRGAPELQKHEIYVSNSLQITNRIDVDENFPAFYLARCSQQHSKSLNNLTDTYNVPRQPANAVAAALHATSSSELAKCTARYGSTPQRSPSSVSVDQTEQAYARDDGAVLSDKCDSVSEHNVYGMPHVRTLSASPTNGSDLNYQNSEISIRSHGLYAPQADNDLNLTLTEDYPYQSSNASEADDVLNDFDEEFPNVGTPLSNDLEPHAADNHDIMMDTSIDELYEAIKRRNPTEGGGFPATTINAALQQNFPLANTTNTPNKTEPRATVAATAPTAIGEAPKSFRESLNDTIEDDSSQSSVISYIDPHVNRQ